MVDGDGLCDLEEADQPEPVEALGAGLVGVDLGQAGGDGWVGGDTAVDVREPEEATEAVHMVLIEESRIPLSWRWRMYSSMRAR
jgi:hypothetical protein